MNNKTIKIIVILISIIAVILIAIFNYTNTYKIQYKENASYEIVLKNNQVIVKSEKYLECVKAPCPTKKETKKIKFSKEHMNIIRKFIKEQCKDNRSITLNRSQLEKEDLIILESIIYNDESMLEENYERNNRTNK